MPVEVVINPSASAVTTASGLTVAADSYEVAFTPVGGSQQTLAGTLPTISVGLGFPSSWVNAAGIPYQVTFGWVGSTGGAVEVHEVNNVSIGTASGVPPTLSTIVSDNASQAPPSGSTMDYNVAVSNATGASSDPGPINVSDTVPTGESPLGSGLGGTGWACSISGQQVSCSNTGPLAGGSPLATLTIPVTVTASAGTVLTNTVSSSSNDSNPASGEDTVTVAKIPTSFTASANPTSTSYGNTVTLGASSLPTAATGTVTFASGGSTLCSGLVSGGSASCSTGILAPAAYSVTATYGGDSNDLGSTASTSFTISQASTSFTASANPTTTSFGNAVTLHGAGLPSGATGTVTFASGGSTLCSGSASSGSVSCNTSASLAPATYSVTATYAGDTNYSGSTASTSFTITKISTSFTASASPTTTSYGNTATLSESGLPAATTGGTVTFTAGGSTLCTATIAANGSASCTTGVLAAGTYSVTATYGGNTDYAGSSASTSFTVSKANTSFSATANPTTTTYGNPVTLQVTGLPNGATGTVTFSSGGSTLCSGSASSGSVSCTTSASLAPATYPVTATYSGDSNYAGSTAPTSFVITTIPTSFSATANPTTTTYGNAVTLQVTGLPSGATGTVTFTSGGSTLCSGPVSSGPVSCTTSASLAPATYPVTATYGGDNHYAASTASSSFVVTTIPTGFTASPDPAVAVYGHAVTLQATGLPAGATGTVTFSAGVATLCSGAISAGAVTCLSSTPLSIGNYSVTANYPGDPHYAASSAQTSFSIAAPPLVHTAMSASASPSLVPTGSTVTLTATGLPAAATGTVTFSSSGTSLCSAPLASGLAWCSASAGTAGTYAVSAAYSGDNIYAGSSASASFTVSPAGVPPAIGASANPARGSSSTGVVLEVSGLPSGATGTVTFTWNGSVLCTATVTGPTATCTPTTALPAGNYSVTVTYSGDSAHRGSSTTTDFVVLAGYWLVGEDGGVFSFSTSFHLSTWSVGFRIKIEGKVVAIAPTPDDAGYWLVTRQGQVIAFGDAVYHGDALGAGKAGHLAGVIAGIAATADGGGYWLVTSQGAVVPFGDAKSYGDSFTAGEAGHLAGQIVGMAATRDGLGYWLVGSDGKVLPFGEARSYGDAYSTHKASRLAGPIVAMALTSDDHGYWLAGAEGGVFAFGDARFMGNPYTVGAAGHLAGPVVGVASTNDGLGYWLTTKDGEVIPFGDAHKYGDIFSVHDNGRLVGPIVGIVGLARNA